MNGIGVAEIETRRPIAIERYSDNRTLGAFVLIDAETNATVGAGMVREVLNDAEGAINAAPVTPLERASRWGHAGVVLRLNAPVAVAHALERALLQGGAFVVRPPDDDPTTPGVLAGAGALVLVAEESDDLVSLRIGSSRAEFVPRAGVPRGRCVLVNLLRRAKVLQRERATMSVLSAEFDTKLAHVRQQLRQAFADAPDTDDACLTCSFQAEDVLLLKLASSCGRSCRLCFWIRAITSRRPMRIATASRASGMCG